MVVKLWHRVISSRLLSLHGYVAFNLPRLVTALGAALLMGLVGFHVYLLSTAPDLPRYFVVYVAALTLGCVAAAAGMSFSVTSWYLGSAVCTIFLGIYLVSRFVGLPGLVTLTGRWDVAPGTFAMACAAGFLAVHTTVLSGINVAYPQQRNWHD